MFFRGIVDFGTTHEATLWLDLQKVFDFLIYF